MGKGLGNHSLDIEKKFSRSHSGTSDASIQKIYGNKLSLGQGYNPKLNVIFDNYLKEDFTKKFNAVAERVNKDLEYYLNFKPKQANPKSKQGLSISLEEMLKKEMLELNRISRLLTGYLESLNNEKLKTNKEKLEAKLKELKKAKDKVDLQLFVLKCNFYEKQYIELIKTALSTINEGQSHKNLKGSNKETVQKALNILQQLQKYLDAEDKLLKTSEQNTSNSNPSSTREGQQNNSTSKENKTVLQGFNDELLKTLGS